MPVRIIRIVHRVDALRVCWVFDIDQNSVSGAGARRQSDGRIRRDVVTLISLRGFLWSVLAV